MASKVQTCIDKLSIKRDNVFSKIMHSKFDASHKTKLANLCQILYGELPNGALVSHAQTTSKTATIAEAEKQLFHNLIHLWYNNISVIEELHKLFNLSGLCFLHIIRFTFGKDMEKTTIWIEKHSGKSNVTFSMFNPETYIKNQIRNCPEKFMAIPINFQFHGTTAAHANILFVKLTERNKNEKTIVEMERFDPHGSLYNSDPLKSQYVNYVMQSLGNLLFPSEHYEVKPLIEPINHCPEINVRGLQSLTAGSSYEGSCTIFALLYSILKLINPERTQSEIANDIHKILQKHNNPTMILILIINVLKEMLNVTKEGPHYYIATDNGEKRKLTINQQILVNNWINDVGKNVVMYKNRKYEGKFEDGLFVEGTITFPVNDYESRETYVGKINKYTMQLNDPEGELTWKDGRTYKGNFVDGKITGKGLMRYDNGDFYEGDFMNGKMTGKGTFTHSDGEIYKGDLLNEKYHGKGIYHFKEGDVYEGDWHDDEMIGKGVMRYANGNVYDGEWYKDYMSGNGVMRYANGDVYDGEWHKDKMDGMGKYTKANGEVIEGKFVKGVYKKTSPTRNVTRKIKSKSNPTSPSSKSSSKSSKSSKSSSKSSKSIDSSK
jgi:hypothetical protein